MEVDMFGIAFLISDICKVFMHNKVDLKVLVTVLFIIDVSWGEDIQVLAPPKYTPRGATYPLSGVAAVRGSYQFTAIDYYHHFFTAHDLKDVYATWYKRYGPDRSNAVPLYKSSLDQGKTVHEGLVTVKINRTTSIVPYTGSDIYVNLTERFVSHTLTIRSVLVDDAGDYNCEFTFVKPVTGQYDYVAVTNESHLVVYDPPPPTISIFSIDEAGRKGNYFEEGKPMMVECSMGEPGPEGVDVLFSILNGTTLTSCHLPLEDSDLIGCKAKMVLSRADNKASQWWCKGVWAGNTYKTYRSTISVRFPATKIRMTRPFPLSANPGRRVNITCETDSGNPSPDVQWLIVNQSHIQQDSHYSITVSHLQAEYHGNHTISMLSFIVAEEQIGLTFQCQMNYSDTVYSQSSTLRNSIEVRIEGEYDLVEAEDLRLLCLPRYGETAEKFEWFFTAPGSAPKLVGTEQTYVRRALSPADRGNYTCHGSTGLISAEDTVSVTVQTLQSLHAFNGTGSEEKSKLDSQTLIYVGAGTGGFVVLLIVVSVVAVVMVKKHRDREACERRASGQQLTPGYILDFHL